MEDGYVDDFEISMLEEISKGETNKLEFKADLPAEHKKFIKTVVAFSNSTGGRILFGIRDDREIIGIPDETLYRIKDAITDSIYKSCHPKITPEIYVVTLRDRNIIVVDVQPGQECPYFIKSEGLEKGTYIRVSGTSMPANEETIKTLQMRGKKLSFDVMENPSVEVVQSELESLCARLSSYNLEIAPVNLEDFKVIKKRGRGYIATNAYALLTSNPFLYARVQCARFRGPDELTIVDSVDLVSDVVSQVEGAVSFVKKHLNLNSKIEGLVRKDSYEIPEVAFREAIVNAVVHREYMMEGCCIFVRIYDDRLVIESPGLPLGLDVNNLKSGHSKMRNDALGSVFKAMGFIERYGTGIRRMFSECSKAGIPGPEFVEDGDFLVFTFRRPKEASGDSSDSSSDSVSLVLSEIRKNPSISQSQIVDNTGLSIATVKRIVSDLRKSGAIKRKGNNRRGSWIIML